MLPPYILYKCKAWENDHKSVWCTLYEAMPSNANLCGPYMSIIRCKPIAQHVKAAGPLTPGLRDRGKSAIKDNSTGGIPTSLAFSALSRSKYCPWLDTVMKVDSLFHEQVSSEMKSMKKLSWSLTVARPAGREKGMPSSLVSLHAGTKKKKYITSWFLRAAVVAAPWPRTNHEHQR